MIFPGKRPDQITEEDLNSLIENEVQERRDVEYKLQMYGTSDEDKREMLRDITAMANAEGGYIFVGIQEEERIAKEILGIENGDREAKRIEDSCLSNIDPRIIGLTVYPVLLTSKEENKSVIAIYVPRSLNAPHMVTYKGLNQFWIRHTGGKSPMSTFEVKEAVRRIDRMMDKLEKLWEKRKNAILERMEDKPLLYVSVTPSFLEEGKVDVENEEIRRLMTSESRCYGAHPGRPVPWYRRATVSRPELTLQGCRIREEQTPNIWSELEVFTNGHIEYKTAITDAYREYFGLQAQALAGAQAVAQIVDFFGFAEKVYEISGIDERVFINFNFFNARGVAFVMFVGNQPYVGPEKIFEEGQHLEIPEPIRLPTVRGNSVEAAKRVSDYLYIGFEGDKCPEFGEDGKYNPHIRQINL